MTVKREKAMCRDSIASEPQNGSDRDGSPEIAADLDDDVYWARPLDDAYRLQFEPSDAEAAALGEELDS